MEITCDMARDLADIYESGKASEETVCAVEKHLEGCKECRGYYESRNERRTPRFRVETSGIDAELIEENLRKLSKRLRVRQVIGSVCAVATAVIGLSALLYNFIAEYKRKQG